MSHPDDDLQRLRDHIKLGLLTGGVHVDADQIHIPLSTWRALARRIAHELDRPVTTGATERYAWAHFKDWGRTPEEHTINCDLARRIIEARDADHPD
ncbi:hypothetical protein ACIRCZ_18770 [Leifsonia sp. NPDC102414]|uniref:hypothetical protein n=1 Tax=Leifsonia sp. NPDC102414 TaxID=3364124 RepID=UPI0038278443